MSEQEPRQIPNILKKSKQSKPKGGDIITLDHEKRTGNLYTKVGRCTVCNLTLYSITQDFDNFKSLTCVSCKKKSEAMPTTVISRTVTYKPFEKFLGGSSSSYKEKSSPWSPLRTVKE